MVEHPKIGRSLRLLLLWLQSLSIRITLKHRFTCETPMCGAFGYRRVLRETPLSLSRRQQYTRSSAGVTLNCFWGPTGLVFLPRPSRTEWQILNIRSVSSQSIISLAFANVERILIGPFQINTRSSQGAIDSTLMRTHCFTVLAERNQLRTLLPVEWRHWKM